VHICPAAGGADEQPAAPSSPGSRYVNVTLMFGAARNVIKAGTSSAMPVASGGFVSTITGVLNVTGTIDRRDGSMSHSAGR
jgi:hypothetical protein